MYIHNTHNRHTIHTVCTMCILYVYIYNTSFKDELPNAKENSSNQCRIVGSLTCRVTFSLGSHVVCHFANSEWLQPVAG